VVDMRWGVRDEMTDEHMTTALCMNELRSALMLHSLLLFFPLKRLSHEIFTVIFWLEWIYLCRPEWEPLLVFKF
jgi:hypothetical protein